MEQTKRKTIKRNGVIIIYPDQVSNEEKMKSHVEVVLPKIVIKPKTNSKDKKQNKKIKPTGCSIRRCIHCGEAVWRSNVSYCWECYKYENYESR